MDPDTITLKRGEYRTLREKALGITDRAMAEERQLTDDEQKQLGAAVQRAKAIHRELEGDKLHAPAELMKSLEEFSHTPEAWSDGDGVKVPSVEGHAPREPHVWTKALRESTKAVTGGGQGAVVVGSLGDPAARLGTPGGELLALLNVESWEPRGDGSSIEVLRQETRALNAAIVATGAVKPSSSIGLGMVAANVWTFAHVVPGVPLQWFQDAGNLDVLVREELAYGVELAVEDGLINGAGPLPGAPLGLLHDPAIPAIVAADNPPDSVLAGLTAVSSAGYATGVVALNPLAWEAILNMKDLNDRPIYGGSPFAGPQRTLWNSPVILSNAIPEHTAIVGDIGGAVRFVERQPVQIIVGTQNDDLVRNLRTVVGEARAAFVTVRPNALAIVALGADALVGSRKPSSKATSKS